MKRYHYFPLKAFGVLALLSAGAYQASAAPVSPDAAKAEASAFLATGHSGMKAKPANIPLTLAYTSSSAQSAEYYIFNHEDGFVIISADDRLPSVLGYSDHGKFDMEKIPENMKWWLGEYSREISAWLPGATETLPETRPMRAPRKPIAPLTTTKWNQTKPYNNDCPMDDYGKLSVTGCVATAMAQIMKYHAWPRNPQGSSGGVDFTNTYYYWNQMIDDYENNDYTVLEAAAVAQLMRDCGAGVNMQYSSWSSGAYDNEVPYALIHYFKYNPAMKLVWKDYTPYSEWSDLVYGELAAGRPLYYSGSSSQGGHAFVCDGYSENEFFHFNWGWGGYEDGYFRLTALNPASGGVGSYEGGYNSGQTIITGLEPNKIGAEAAAQTALVSTGGFYYENDNLYEIKKDPRNYNLVYNPLCYSEKLTIGLKFQEIDNPAATAYYANAGQVSLDPLYGFTQLRGSTPQLPDGVYSITPVFAETTNNWQPILIPLGYQNYVRLTVKGREYTYENVGPDASHTANVIACMPVSTPQIYGNADLAFRLPLLNIGDGDYIGNISFSLMDPDDDFGDAVSTAEATPIPGNGYTQWDMNFNERLKPGTYKLYVINDAGERLINGVNVSVVDGNFPELTQIQDCTFEELAPNFIESETKNPMYFTISSNSIYDENVSIKFTVIDALTFKKVKDLQGYTLKIPANYSGRAVLPPIDWELDPGEYMWYVSDSNGNRLSPATPLIVTSPAKKAGNFEYVVTDKSRNKCMLLPPTSGVYTGTLEVPEKIDGYTVTSLRPDAFAFSTVTTLSLPEGVTSIPRGGFAKNTSLRSLTLNSPVVMGVTEDSFYSLKMSDCWLNVSDELANIYYNKYIWSRFRMPCWGLNLDNVEIAEGMLLNPETGLPYSPYCVNCFTPLTLRLSAPDGMNVEVLVVHNGDWIEYHTIDPTVTEVNLPALGEYGTGRFHATATNNPVAVENIRDITDNAPVYSIDGRLIYSSASASQIKTLPAGLYIIGNRKYIVK